MTTRGTKVESRSVWDQPHELKYEAIKEGTSTKAVKDAKKTVGTQRAAIEKKVK